MKLSRVLGLTRLADGKTKVDMPIVYDLKIDHGAKMAVSTHMNIIRSGWDLMRVVTMVVRSICTECLVYSVCSGTCEDYQRVYWSMAEWLSECEHKVSEEEFEEKLNELS